MRQVTFLLVLLVSIPALSQAKPPITFEDMMKLKRVGEPVPSPDRKWVLFSAVDVDLAANTKTPHIWIVPLGASGASSVPPGSGEPGDERVLIADQDGDRPRWAPDGKRFAFISLKEGGSQVWIARFDGATGTVTAVQRLTGFPTEADGELWSPDGGNIVFTSDVYPECDGAPDGEQSCNAKKLKQAEESKVKAIIFDRLLYRHWNSYKEGKRRHIFIVQVPASSSPGGEAPSAAPPRNLTPGDYDAPVFSLGGQDGYAFSPDGREICYTSNHDKVEAASTNNDLWTVPVNGGPAKNITADNPASDSTPLYSPDGNYIAYRGQRRPGYESDRFRLMLYDRKSAEKKNLTEDFDRSVGTFTWTPNSKQLYFVAENKGRSPVFRIESNGTALSRLEPCHGWFTGGSYDDLQFSTDGRTLLASGSTAQGPADLVAFDLRAFEPPGVRVCSDANTAVVATPSEIELAFDQAHGIQALPLKTVGWRQLTHQSVVVAGLGMPIEDFWFHGANGDPVQGFIIRPPDVALASTRKYPVKFLIHGGPQGAWGDDWSFRWNPELFAANGYVVIMINFHGSTGYGQNFIDAINGDWGGAPFEDLMKGLDYAEKTYPFIDKDRECALGASYGGYMANWVLGHTDRFKCIVSHDGMFNTVSAWGTTEELWFNNWEFKGTPYTNPEMYEKWSPRNSAKKFKTPTLVIHGQRDYRLDVSEGFQLFTTLQTMGVPSKMLYFPDEGHWVLKPQNSELWYKTVNDWVDRWTKK
jgi:dipeptidyl aminopeptidase/acylaminoacyl peptidase